MALIFIDGFDHYSAQADIGKKWSAASSTFPTISTTGGRRGGGCASFPSSATYYAERSIGSTATAIVGIALYRRDTTTGDILRFYEGATLHLTLTVDVNYKLRLYTGTSSGGTLLATGTTTISQSAWTYIELKATIGNSGAYEVKINGVSEFSSGSADTQNGGTATMDKVRIGGGPNSYVDDVYICDSSGSTNNDFLGDCRIDTLLPTGDGYYTDFTPSTGTSHYALVDETAPNTTDYVSSATSGHRDSYAFPDLTALVSQTVYGVQINAAALKSDSGSRSLGTMSRLSSTDKDGSGVALGTSQDFVTEIQETDPASAAWTEANINAAEFGVKVTA